MVRRIGRFGAFEGCSNYPACKYIKREPRPERPAAEKTGVHCPVCGTGELVKRVASKGPNKGNVFYGCSNFPQCKTIVNELPKEGEAAQPATAAAPSRRSSAASRVRAKSTKPANRGRTPRTKVSA